MHKCGINLLRATKTRIASISNFTQYKTSKEGFCSGWLRCEHLGDYLLLKSVS